MVYWNRETRLRIEVYATKSNKFRADVNENGNKYSITVLGKSWQAGHVDKKHIPVILELCHRVTNRITIEALKLQRNSPGDDTLKHEYSPITVKSMPVPFKQDTN